MHRCSRSDRKTTLLLGTSLLFAAAWFLSAGAAQAQFHGVAIAKQCEQQKAFCAEDDTLCNDDNECTADACVDPTPPNTGGNEVVCFIRVTNDDDFGDTLTIVDVPAAPGGETSGLVDKLTNCTGAGCPNFSQTITIDSVSSGATCAAGNTALPCTLPAPGGRVIFKSTGYTVVETDPSPLNDTATATLEDECDAPMSTGCPAGEFEQNIGASTTLLGCTNTPTPSVACTLEDNNDCTESGCNAAGVCDPLHNLLSSVTCDDIPDTNECGDPGCENGVCVPDHFVEAPSFACTTFTDTGSDDLCVPNHCDGTGVCTDDPNGQPVVCVDPTCGTSVCDPTTGLCEDTCFVQADCADPAIAAECCIVVSDCIWNDTGTDCQVPDTCPGDGEQGVDVNLLLCDGGTGVPTGLSDTTDSGGLYSITAISINTTTCEPEQNNWAIDVEETDFITEDDPLCANDEQDSDCDSTGFTGCDPGIPANPGTPVTSLDCGLDEEECVCVVIIDEEGLDNDFRSVEFWANDANNVGKPGFNVNNHGVLPSQLINDDCHPLVCPTGFGDNKVPTEVGNPWLLWNLIGAGDVVKLPTGVVDDEGWFALPEEEYLLEQKGWSYADFVAGTIPQSELDKVPGVMPIRNQDLADMVGQTCVAIVYDSDISMNYQTDVPVGDGTSTSANLQGARYGRFAFTLLAVETPGSVNGDPFPNVLPESKSSTSLYDVWIRVENPIEGCFFSDVVELHDHEPDSCQIKRASWNNGTLTVIGESDRGGPNGSNNHFSVMTFTIDGPDIGGDPDIDPVVLEGSMTFVSGKKYTATLNGGFPNVIGRRISIQTDEGCAYNGRVRNR